MSQSKYFSFTLNNYTDEEYSGILRSLECLTDYFIVGKETGDQGTPHLQGYCAFKKRYRFTGAKKAISPRCHIEVSRGTPADNRIYCSKEGDFYEFGTCPTGTQGGRPKKDRDQLAVEFRDSLVRGRLGVSEFSFANPGVFSWSGHTLLRNAMGSAGAISRPEVSVRWIYGPPGVGKSRFAHQEYPDAYIKEPRTKWWTGYLLEDSVIIDDFGPNGIDINHLLRWFDRYKCYVETKGDMVPLHATKFIVTSNFSPADVFKSNVIKFDSMCSNQFVADHPQLPALLRRMSVIHMEQ